MATVNQSKDQTSKPLYSQIEDALRRRIEYGEFKSGCQIPTEIELMETFQVSRTTVRTAVANLVNDGLLCRVQGRGTFVAEQETKVSTPSRERVSQENMSIGVVIAGLMGYQPSTVIRGIEAALRANDVNLMLLSSNINPDIEKENLERLLRADVQGIIIWPSGHQEDAVRRIVETSQVVPVLLIDCFFRGIDLPYVVSDNFGGAYEAADYLISRGCQRIGFVSTMSPTEPGVLSSISERYRGYVMALENNGMVADEALLFSHWNYSFEHTSFAEYVKRNQIDAILIENDNVLVQVVKVCQEKGIRIPDDLTIVGFDDSQILSSLSFPVSSVRQRWYDMGYTAGRMMIKMIYGEHSILDRQIVLPIRLMIRDL
ncbi:MAG: GntR family transcriptional regulator [Limnochordia bacterium]|nr:GntR family transcriptional regulator [Limnochordia bacterium]MDD2629807.1 GntR family transcriptional regulator [Limnochordia bacterium]MDD4519028.1 GntR family transcriptional regulator [Limnochordia bacterium]